MLELGLFVDFSSGVVADEGRSESLESSAKGAADRQGSQRDGLTGTQSNRSTYASKEHNQLSSLGPTTAGEVVCCGGVEGGGPRDFSTSRRGSSARGGARKEEGERKEQRPSLGREAGMEVDLVVFLGLVGLLVLIALTLLAFALHSGLNYVPEVASGPCPLPQCQIAYKFLRGAYGGAAVGATFTEVTSIAPKARVLGIFYDNPQEVAEEKLRCAVGVVVSAEDQDPLPEETLKLLREKGFKFRDLPGIGASVNSSFPHTTSLSIRLAPIRVNLKALKLVRF